jgi:peptidoglycan/LPS O-acetylase OafA/YrhL
MAGVTVGVEGISVTNALAGHPIFAWATWGLQVMPLFFLLGGFSSISQWRRMRDDGATASDYIRLRVNRLARPAVLPIALVGATLTTLALIGFHAEVLQQVGFRIGQPLWFLAVYLGCCAFVPLMTRLHERAPLLTLGGLLLAAIAFDALSAGLNLPLLRAFNFLFVWLFVQQLGFWAADGWFARRRRWMLLAGTVAAYGILTLLTSFVGYSKDMYENLNPPSVCILVLGVGQVFLISFLRPWLDRVANARVMVGANAVNRNSMTIYLWHVPVVVIIALTMLSIRMAFPDPLSRDWWESRPLFLLAVGVALAPVVFLLARWEQTHAKFVQRRTPPAIAACKVVFGVAGVATILLFGFLPVLAWAIGLGLLVLAVWVGPPPVKLLQRVNLRLPTRHGSSL